MARLAGRAQRDHRRAGALAGYPAKPGTHRHAPAPISGHYGDKPMANRCRDAIELVLGTYAIVGLVGQLCGQSLATRIVTVAALRLALVLLGSCRRWFSTRAKRAADDSTDNTGVARVYPEAGIWTF